VSAEPSAVSAGTPAAQQTGDFSKAAMAILLTMVVLIVALTGILVETTWSNHDGSAEVLPLSSDPGSFARR
jgi:predicted permease